MPRAYFSEEDALLVADCIGTRPVTFDKAYSKLIKAGLATSTAHAANLLGSAGTWGLLQRQGPPFDSQWASEKERPTVCRKPDAVPVRPEIGGPPDGTAVRVHLISPDGTEVIVDRDKVDEQLAAWRQEKADRRREKLRAELEDLGLTVPAK